MAYEPDHTSIMTHLGSKPRIECYTESSDSKHGYPVLVVGGVSIFASVAQIRQIAEVCENWLKAFEGAVIEEELAADADAEAVIPKAVVIDLTDDVLTTMASEFGR